MILHDLRFFGRRVHRVHVIRQSPFRMSAKAFNPKHPTARTERGFGFSCNIVIFTNWSHFFFVFFSGGEGEGGGGGGCLYVENYVIIVLGGELFLTHILVLPQLQP